MITAEIIEINLTKSSSAMEFFEKLAMVAGNRSTREEILIAQQLYNQFSDLSEGFSIQSVELACYLVLSTVFLRNEEK